MGERSREQALRGSIVSKSGGASMRSGKKARCRSSGEGALGPLALFQEDARISAGRWRSCVRARSEATRADA